MNGSFAKVNPKSLVIAEPRTGDQHCPKYTEQRADKKVFREEFSIKLFEPSDCLQCDDCGKNLPTVCGDADRKDETFLPSDNTAG